MTQNGDHVTWRELNLALDPMKDDIAEIKDDVKAMRGNTWLGPRGHEFMAGGAVFLAVASVAIAIFIH